MEKIKHGNCTNSPISKSSASHRITKLAVLAGILPTLDGSIQCSDCDEPATEYDHRDYMKPLDVAPVCRSCNCVRGSALNHTKPTTGNEVFDKKIKLERRLQTQKEIIKAYGEGGDKAKLTREDAICLFGSRKAMADAMGTTIAAVSMLPSKGYLVQKKSDQIVGYLLRTGRLGVVQEVES